eukprot:XP_011682741.1 PREDICTED: slit homolog 2 protein-like [Strongylocentrotus purpuratus]
MAFDTRRGLLPLVLSCYLLSFSIPILAGDATGTASVSSYHDYWECDGDPLLKTAQCQKRGFVLVPQNLHEDIEYLDMSFNNLTYLSSTSFARYPLITYLNLAHNDIRAIDSTAFYPFINLSYLLLNFNVHIVLPDTGLFRLARNLNLNLSNTHLKRLPSDALQWTTRFGGKDPVPYSIELSNNELSFINISVCGTIRYASFDRNQIEDLTVESFNFVCHATALFLAGNPIKSVDPKVIASLHVRRLHLGDYPLNSEVMRNVFIGVAHSEIEYLSVENASLNALPKDFFDPLLDKYLSVLDLTDNYVYPIVFSNLTKIDELILYGNRIDIIEPNLFDGMEKIKVLYFNNNRIRHINPRNHTWNIGVLELHLQINLLTVISQSAFLGLENLTFIDLSYNKLLVFEQTAFTDLRRIQTIHVRYCSIFRWQLESSTLRSLTLKNTRIHLKPSESFKQSLFLEHLDLSSTDLGTLNVWDATMNISLFDGLFNLTTLDLSRNHLLGREGALTTGVFRQLSALQQLYLHDCDVTTLNPNVFKGLGQVTIINLDDNNLAYLEDSIFLNNPKLTSIALSCNNLTHLKLSTFQPIISSLSSLDLSMNPIVCNCDLKWLPSLLNGQFMLINADYTICSEGSLDPARARPLLQFDPDELCERSIVLFYSLPLASMCLIEIYSIQILLVKNKIFLLKLAALGYREVRDARDHIDFEFDLNFIFYDDDEEWIREHLRAALADQLPQFHRNVFGDGDLVVGMHYLDSVDYVVSHSYKTIILLSRAAVHDRWFMLKLRTAPCK